MLLTEEPACTLATRSAGVVEFRATLEWDEPPDRPPACLPASGPFFRHELEKTLEPAGTKLRISGPILALTEEGLGEGLRLAMRAATNAAALSGAVLQMLSLRESPPRPAPPGPLQALALDLWRAGFPVRFAPSWTPAGPAGLSLGAGGEEEAVRGFLRESPVWGEPPLWEPS